MQQHRSIDVGDATLDCTVCGLGTPAVLLANAGCSTGYFDHLARALVTGGFQTISIDMRGVGGSCGSLDGATLHDLAGDVAGVIKAIGYRPPEALSSFRIDGPFTWIGSPLTAIICNREALLRASAVPAALRVKTISSLTARIAP